MTSNSLLLKITTCFVAGITVAALLLLLGNSGSLPWFPPVVVFSLVGLSLLVALIFPFIWQLKEKKRQVNSEKVYGFICTLIRYCLAFNLASFGWKKLLGLQFVVPIDIASRPMNQQSGEWLTWYYFGHSAAFGFIVAAIQIIGSYLLLFRRTMLLAEVILFSFMLNLMLINIFYQMNAGALLQSVVITIAILFLMLLEYRKLVNFFLKAPSYLPSMPSVKPSVKTVVRLSAIVLSLLFTMYLKTSLH
ncbi:hypothetical protein [Segetibacter aerophilus]|uniref:hypothetical protein n=1 Tax=Segetibacter aerophilus TaxID=670293 RepID=UPI0011BE7485|nr:hypothetical protein [Segetibacter aerophilus]